MKFGQRMYDKPVRKSFERFLRNEFGTKWFNNKDVQKAFGRNKTFAYRVLNGLVYDKAVIKRVEHVGRNNRYVYSFQSVDWNKVPVREYTEGGCSANAQIRRVVTMYHINPNWIMTYKSVLEVFDIIPTYAKRILKIGVDAGFLRVVDKIHRPWTYEFTTKIEGIYSKSDRKLIEPFSDDKITVEPQLFEDVKQRYLEVKELRDIGIKFVPKNLKSVRRRRIF